MASKKKQASKGEDAPRSKESKSKKALLQRIHDRYRVMTEADQTNRSEAKEDLRFVNVPGAQWDENMKKERGDRPCLEANTLRINGKRVINEIRANRPQGHVRAVEGGDKKGAELREGLVRNILNISDFDTITDQAAEYQVDGGFGAWRVDTEYADDSMWDQDILVKAIKNPLDSLWWDPACEDILLKRDAEDWLVIKSLSNSAYEAKYGDAEKFDFEGEDVDDWEDDETVRVVEYWYKEPYDKELWLVELPNQETGQMDRLTVDSTSDEAQALTAQGVTPTKTRMVRCHKIMMCLASGKSILEGPVEIGGAQFPFVVVFGEVKVVDGKVKWWGLHRFSKDAQQIQNVFWTAAAETVANAPKAVTWATVDQAKGLLPSWAEAHRKNFPTRLYNADAKAPGAPVQHPGAQVPVAMLEMVALSSDLVRTTSGLHEEAFGEESNAKSGIAIGRKQRQAAIVTYNFPDNMAKAAKRTGEIILDRIPIVYDAERELRILGVDGAEDYKRVNQLVFDPATGTTKRVDDLTSGKYDFYVKAGPSYSSMREEASEIYGEFVQKFPELMGVAGDLIFKASDLPYSDEIAKRMQTLLPPQIQQQLGEGKELPPEVMQAQAQVQQAMQMVQQQGQLVQAAAQEVEQSKAEAQKEQAKVQTLIANLKTEEARFEAKVAQVEAKFAQRDAQFAETQATAGNDDQREKLGTDLQQAIVQMQQQAAEFQQQAVQTLAEIMGKQQTQVFVPPSPKPKQLRGSRDRATGEMVITPIYDDAAPTGIQ